MSTKMNRNITCIYFQEPEFTSTSILSYFQSMWSTTNLTPDFKSGIIFNEITFIFVSVVRGLLVFDTIWPSSEQSTHWKAQALQEGAHGSWKLWIPSKHEALTQCCFNVGPASKTVCQHWNSFRWMPRVCWVLPTSLFTHFLASLFTFYKGKMI